jgi:hypothetical protein
MNAASWRGCWLAANVEQLWLAGGRMLIEMRMIRIEIGKIPTFCVERQAKTIGRIGTINVNGR